MEFGTAIPMYRHLTPALNFPNIYDNTQRTFWGKKEKRGVSEKIPQGIKNGANLGGSAMEIFWLMQLNR